MRTFDCGVSSKRPSLYEPIKNFSPSSSLLYGRLAGIDPSKAGASRFDGCYQQHFLCLKSRASRVHLSRQPCSCSLTAAVPCDELFKSFLCSVYDEIQKTLLTQAFSQSGFTTDSRYQIFLNWISSESGACSLTQQKEMQTCYFNYTFGVAN